ncbi:uncharacterized protein LAESUDRAFT_716769 [Laetiporus sulphureus 93-53]|uniref:DEAD/DEAH box helicase domain-containing protein n=1 Tax=Laetiporus sulphureus 93-53 TaxID=1314785 RepID=A0A165CCE4_9APHY|nr:uncharacterized protein LAESUDRAFT_716769 [Laetiporus sulphureus 93-53]KZT02557.1 hypothetical protein LAESUDRAFT_716769 [Laetiporus sulphureus 93-53]
MATDQFMSGNTVLTLSDTVYKLLHEARTAASYQRNYSSVETRAQLTAEFKRVFNINAHPYDWQLDVTEAILVRLNAIVIAGTEAGKMIPFAMPLLLDHNSSKMIIIISLLNELEEDQWLTVGKI